MMSCSSRSSSAQSHYTTHVPSALSVSQFLSVTRPPSCSTLLTSLAHLVFHSRSHLPGLSCSTLAYSTYQTDTSVNGYDRNFREFALRVSVRHERVCAFNSLANHATNCRAGDLCNNKTPTQLIITRSSTLFTTHVAMQLLRNDSFVLT